MYDKGLSALVASAMFIPALQDGGELFGIPWWVWVLLLVILLVILFIALVRQEEPGPELPKPEPTPEPGAGMEARAAEQPSPIVADEEEAGKEAMPSEAEPTPVAAEEEEPAAVREHVEKPKPVTEPDDLRKIEGIGPKISSLLQEAGIKTFAQLAESDTVTIQKILDDAKLRLADPSTWAQQAMLASEGRWEDLAKLQDELKGGQRA